MEAKKTFDDIQSAYDSDSTTETFNALVYGDIGTGKTYLARTCIQPVLIHSFDPGGTKSLSDVIEGGDVYVEKFESENSKKPTEYARWEKRFDELRNVDERNLTEARENRWYSAAHGLASPNEYHKRYDEAYHLSSLQLYAYWTYRR